MFIVAILPKDNQLKRCADYREKDGYTIETVDIYGVENGQEVIVISKVGLYASDELSYTD